MNAKKINFIVLAILLISTATVLAGETEGEGTLINTVISQKANAPLPSFTFNEIARPSVSPTSQQFIAESRPIDMTSRKEFAAYFRGEKTENTLFTTSLVAMAALNVADYVLTRQALRYPGLKEGNPLMKPFVKNAVLFAAVKAGTTVLSIYGLKKLFKRDRTTAWVLTMASNFVLSYVVANNMRSIQKARAKMMP